MDDGAYGRAVRLIGMLSRCNPDPATARVLEQAHRQLELLLVDASSRQGGPRGSVGRRVSIRSALRALLVDGATLGSVPSPVARSDAAAAAYGNMRIGDRQLAVRVLGSFEVWVHGMRVPQWSSRRSRDVLGTLVVHRGRPVPRERLMDQLWPTATAAAAGNSLSVAVHALRRTLCAAHPDGAEHDYVLCHDGAYQLSPGLATWVDVEQFDSHHALGMAARRAGDANAAAAHFEVATDLYRGALFEDDRSADPATARVLEQAHRQLELLLVDASSRQGGPRGSVGRRVSIRSALRALLVDGATLGSVPSPVARSDAAAAAYGNMRIGDRQLAVRVLPIGIWSAVEPCTRPAATCWSRWPSCGWSEARSARPSRPAAVCCG